MDEHGQYSFFNQTIGLEGEELQRKVYSAQSQEGKILDYFKANPEAELTPYQVLNKVFNGSCPKSSVSRALRQLTRAEYLVKTDKKAMGAWDVPNHKWKLAP